MSEKLIKDNRKNKQNRENNYLWLLADDIFLFVGYLIIFVILTIKNIVALFNKKEEIKNIYF